MRRMKTYDVFPFNLYCISESLSMADFLWTEFLTSVKLKDVDVDPPELPSTSGQNFNFNSSSVAADAEECDCFAAALDFLPPSPSSPQQREESDLVSLARQASKRRRAPSQCSD